MRTNENHSISGRDGEVRGGGGLLRFMTFLCRWKYGSGGVEWPLMFHSGPRVLLSLVDYPIKEHPEHLTAAQPAPAPLCLLAYCLPPPCCLPYKTSGDTRPRLFQLSLPNALINSLWSNARQRKVAWLSGARPDQILYSHKRYDVRNLQHRKHKVWCLL